MAFKRKTDSGGGDIVSFTKVGDSVTGIYLGGQESDGKFGPCYKHIFNTETGVKVAFTKETSQMHKLLQGEEGKLVKLTFASTKPSGKGNPTKLYTIDIDDEYTPTEAELTADVDNNDDIPSDELQTTAATRSPTQVNAAAVNNVLKQQRRAN